VSDSGSWHNCLRDCGNFLINVAHEGRPQLFEDPVTGAPVKEALYFVSNRYLPEVLERATRARDAMRNAGIVAPLPSEKAAEDPREKAYGMLEELIRWGGSHMVRQSGKRTRFPSQVLPEPPPVYAEAFFQAIAADAPSEKPGDMAVNAVRPARSTSVVLNPGQLAILQILDAQKTTMFQAAISAELGAKGLARDRKTVSKYLKKLRDAGLVYRPRGSREGDAITDLGRQYIGGPPAG
jgi:DNA-binding transcriptional ArsR family regulator